MRRIGVDPLPIGARPRYAQAVPHLNGRREIAYHHHKRLLPSPPDKADNRALGIVVVNPLKPRRYEIERVQGRRGAIKAIQIAHQTLNAAVQVTLFTTVQKMPIQTLVVVPFPDLPKFTAHEQQLFARMPKHETQVSPQIGKFLPGITGHFVQQRTLAMHHFVVRNRQYKIFTEGVGQAKCQFAVMVLSVHRVARHIGQGVVHPAHVPLVMKTQPSCIGRPRNRRERSGFFSQCDRLGPLVCHHFVQTFQECDGFKVFASTIDVGYPLACLSAVVPIEHGSHGIHPQAIDSKALQPIQRVTNQKIANLGASQVVYERVPVIVKAFARVSIFIQGAAVKLRQAVRVCREVRWHPIEQHTQPALMATCDKSRKSRRGAKPRGGRIQPNRLIAPGAVKRMLADWQ